MRAPSIRCSAVLSLTLAATGLAQVPTWTYDPPDASTFPDSSGEPFENGTAPADLTTVSVLDVGGGEFALEFDTIDPEKNVSSFYEQGDNADPGTEWDVSSATGYSVEWRARFDSTFATEQGAADLQAPNGNNFPVLRMFRDAGGGILTASPRDGLGGPQDFHRVPNPNDWHTYRLDVQGDTVSLFLDDYPFPVKTVSGLTVDNSFDFIRLGDVTGSADGRHLTQFLRTYQSGPLGSPDVPDPLDPGNTLFLAHYNNLSGGTPGVGLDADFAVGNPSVLANGALVSATSRFGAGSLDQRTPTSSITYETAGNFELNAGTVEMWIKPAGATWNTDFFGFFDVFGENSDIRIQKRSPGSGGNVLQASFSDRAGTSWSITTTNEVLLDTNWHHLALTWDFDANVAALYVDGQVQPATITLNGLDTIGFTGILAPTFEVGTIQGSSNNFDGLIDELRISAVDLYGGQDFTPQVAEYAEPASAPTAACCMIDQSCRLAMYRSRTWSAMTARIRSAPSTTVCR